MALCKQCGREYSMRTAAGVGSELCNSCYEGLHDEGGWRIPVSPSSAAAPHEYTASTSTSAAVAVGAFIGLVLGYPLSYFCQPSVLRAKCSLGDYISHISDVFRARDLVATAIGVWIGSVIICALLGWAWSAVIMNQRRNGR